MNIRYKTEGFVFRKEDKFDTDRIFSLFTKDFGRIDVFGKAIRKISSKLKGGIDIFSLSGIEFIQGKNKKTLTDAKFSENYKNIINNPGRFQVAISISIILDDFIRGQEPDNQIFNLLKETFSKLNNLQIQDSKLQIFYYYFFWNFMSILGYEPELSICSICQKKLAQQNLYFSESKGGVICHICCNNQEDAIKVSSDFVKVLRLIIRKDWQVLLKLKISNDIKELLRKVSNIKRNYLLLS